MTATDELQKAIQEAAMAGVLMLRKSQLSLDFGAHDHHVAYTRTNASGTVSNIAAKGASGYEMHKQKAAVATARAVDSASHFSAASAHLEAAIQAGDGTPEAAYHGEAYQHHTQMGTALAPAKTAGRSKKTETIEPAATPPQADSNRHKWMDLDDDEHPREAMRRISSKELGKISRGKSDITRRAKEELAARGVDEHGKWLGFDQAAKHHGTEGAKQKRDEIDGHFQTVHHKILGAIAAGHTDPKRLAREELANRGHDHNGNWIGFDKAEKLHKVE